MSGPYELNLADVIPSEPPLITAIIGAFDPYGVGKPGVTISLQQIGPIPVDLATGVLFDGAIVSAVSDANGMAQFQGRVKGATYRYQMGPLTKEAATAVIPETATDGHMLGSLISH